MDAERWRRVDAIFAAALELPEEQRRHYLDTVCGSDQELAVTVESLLEADAPAAALFAQPLGRVVDDEERDAAMAEDSRFFSHYRLQRVLGRSPTASVYLAEREDHLAGQLVALKLLNLDADTASLRQRFVREQQILTSLHHDHIARLYDAGRAEDGRPYLVLEYVEGLPIDLYCRRHALTITQRLELFQQVCAAVQYAHQNLLVHRDVKPANILVTLEGSCKLLDFGIAKSLHPQRFAGSDTTRLGQRPMTPRYASPEQIKGEPISIASDIYALGVLLYELLTDQPCYVLASGAAYELEQAICEQPPVAPSRRLGGRRGSELRGDLDTIVLKTLAKSVSGRYSTVERLGDDIQRHLEKRPVSARPATLIYRTCKLMERHKGAVAAGVVVAGLVVVFMVMLVIQNRRMDQQRRVAEQLRLEANDERLEAEKASHFLIDLFRLANPNQNRGREMTAREILDAGAARVETDLEDHPGLQASLLESLGKVYSDLGVYDRAAGLIELSVERQQELYGPEHPSLAPSLNQLALIYLFQGRYQAAEALVRDALDGWRRTDGADPVDIATAHNYLGSALRHQERAGEALAPLQRAMEILDEHPARSQSLSLLGLAMSDLGRFDAAQQALEEAIDIAELALGAGHPLIARHQLRLASVHNARGDPDRALLVANQAASSLVDALEPGHPLMAEADWEIGRALESKGDLRGAVARYDAALKNRRQRLGLGHPQVLRNAEHLESLVRGLGTAPVSDAAVPTESAVASAGIAAAFDIGAGADPLVPLAESALEVTSLWRRLEAARDTSPADLGRIAGLEACLGVALLRMGRQEEAREHLVSALSSAGSEPLVIENIVDGVLGLHCRR